MPDQRVIATSLDKIERALEREGGGRPPGMVIVGWSVVALAKSQAVSRSQDGGGILDIKGDGLGAYDETRDRARLEQWLTGREYVVREGMEDGWEAFAGLA
jgi:uroporphyrin-III C-methyltransferase